MQKDNTAYKILVIEDNPGDYFLIEEFLEEQMAIPGIIHVETFLEAKSELIEENQHFDAILLDLSLPDRSGEDLIKEIMKICDDTPVIVLTGFTDIRFSVKSLALGVSDYLLKDDLNAPVLYKSIVYSIERTSFTHQLKDSEKRYRELFHLSPQPMWVYDYTSLHFLDVNFAALKHYGFTMEEFQQMTLKDLSPNDNTDDVKFDELLSLTNYYDTATSLGIFSHVKKNGDIIQVDIRVSELNFQGKRARLVLAIDVTERLRYVKAVEEQNRKLQEIAWIQSHVVRAPLSKLMALIQMYDLINESTEMKPEEYRHAILDAADELDAIINNITNKTNQIKLEPPQTGI
jgi:PAS domain S-box-containing protein